MPSIETMSVIALAAVAVMSLFGWIRHRRNVEKLLADRRRLRAKLKKALREKDDALDQVDAFEERLDQFNQEGEELATLRIQSRGYQELVRTVQRERDTWMELYYSQATGHDNAQRWMMRENQSLAQQVKQAGGEPKIHPTILEMRAEFEAEHGQHIEDHKSGKAADSHAQTVQQENERAAELAAMAPPGSDPK